MASQNLLELAKQGNIQAIDMLLGRMLEPRGITAKAVLQDGRLHLLLESDHVLEQATLVPFVHQAISRLGSSEIKSLTVYGKQRGQQGQPWSQVINLTPDEKQDASDGTQQFVSGPAAPPPMSASIASRAVSTSSVSSTPLTLPAPSQSSAQYLPQVPPPPPSLIQYPPSSLPSTSPSQADSPSDSCDDEAIPPLDIAWDGQINYVPVGPTDNVTYSSLEAEPLSASIVPDPNTDDDVISTIETPSGEMPVARAVAVIGLALVLVGIVLIQGRALSGQAQTAIGQADELIAKGIALRKAGNVKGLKAIQPEMAQMSKTLQAIPTIPFLVPDGAAAGDKLDQLEQEQSKLQQQITREESAAKTLKAAQQSAQTAVELIKDASDSLPALQQAESQWEQAITALQSIPANTIAGKEAAQKVEAYQASYAEIQKKIETLSRSKPKR